MGRVIVAEDEKLNVWEKTMERADTIRGFKISFFGGIGSHGLRKVEVRKVNFQDLMRHMRQGESVIITPKLLHSSLANGTKEKSRTAWYFTHM